MTDRDFDKAFGTAPPRSTFAERVGPAPVRPTNGDASEAKLESGVYKPYGYLPTNTVGETCDIQRWMDGTEVAEGIEFQYRFLMQIGYVGEEEIRLFLPDCIVVIAGKNLRDLRKRLARRQVTFIQQHSKQVWPGNPNQSETLVEKIEIVRPSDSLKK